MKLKVNQSCDLRSISALHPRPRRSSASASGLQASQLRMQPLQHSFLRGLSFQHGIFSELSPLQQTFLQGLSFQHGIFSQLSQSSLDEVVTNDQRLCTQEQENCAKKFPCLPRVSNSPEENQMQMSRSSTNPVRKCNPVSASEWRCQINEVLECATGMSETSLNKFGIILDPVQSGVMQVNRLSKEVLLEVQGICQKLVVQDTLLHQMVMACDLKIPNQKVELTRMVCDLKISN